MSPKRYATKGGNASVAPKSKPNSEEVVSNEGVERAQADNDQDRTEAQDGQAQVQGQEADRAEAEEVQASEAFAVELNPKLYAMNMVQLNGRDFYSDKDLNRSKGTSVLSDVEYEELKNMKDPETGLQYVVKEKGVN